MPTWKQNGGYLEPQLRRIYLKYSGHGKFLIDMIREQQEIARSLQSSLPDHQKECYLHIRQKLSKIIKNRRSRIRSI